MDYDTLAMLPPIAASVGGLIPFLLSNNPIGYPRFLRGLIVIIYILVVWIGYLVALLVGEELLYPTTLTIIALTIGAFYLYRIVSGYLRARTLEKGEKETYRDPRRLTRFYLAGIIFVSFGFTNYVAAENKVIVILDLGQGYSLKTAYYESTNGNTEMRFSKPTWRSHALIMDKEVFKSISAIVIEYVAPDLRPDKTSLDKSSFTLGSMGMGEIYEIKIPLYGRVYSSVTCGRCPLQSIFICICRVKRND